LKSRERPATRINKWFAGIHPILAQAEQPLAHSCTTLAQRRARPFEKGVWKSRQALTEGRQRGLIAELETSERRRQGQFPKWFDELLVGNKR
jgi:hypothetical protein